MAAIAEQMGKMVGPLPLGAWVATVGGGLAFLFYQRKQAGEMQTAVEPDPFDAGLSDTGGIPGVGNGSVGGWIPTTPGAAPESVVTAPTDNEQWARLAINHLIASNYNPMVADSAIRKYMVGENLSASEFAMISIALGKLGAPPVPLPPPLFAPPTLPVIGTAPVVVAPVPAPVSKPEYKYYLVKPGQTLKGIANRHPPRTWQDLYNANRKGKIRRDGKPGMIADPNVIKAGWVLLMN